MGIRGIWGDLLLAPKLMPDQFGAKGQLVVTTNFAGKCLKVTYVNRSKKPYGQYKIDSVLFQGRSFPIPDDRPIEVTIPRSTLTQVVSPTVEITVNLA